MSNEAKIQALMESPEFAQEMATLETPEQLQALLARYGVEVSMDEVEGAAAYVAAHSGELSVDDLEDVSGGCILLPRRYPKWLLDLIRRFGQWIVKKYGYK